MPGNVKGGICGNRAWDIKGADECACSATSLEDLRIIAKNDSSHKDLAKQEQRYSQRRAEDDQGRIHPHSYTYTRAILHSTSERRNQRSLSLLGVRVPFPVSLVVPMELRV